MLAEFTVCTNGFNNLSELKVVEIPALADMEHVKLESGCFSDLKSFKYGES